MVTREQALTTREFHYGHCRRDVGPRGGITIRIEEWRANGACRTWKTRPAEFELPIKYGLRTCGYLHQDNADEFHTAADCPINA